MRVHFCGSSASVRWSRRRITWNSSESADSGSGTAPAFSNSAPLWTTSVASPPSSRIMFGPSPSGQLSACSVHHQYSSSVSPFQAKTGMPAAAMAAAAWSWVEKMLHEHQRTSAPRATSVSIRTAVCTVMWSEPMIFAPASGCDGAVLLAHRHEAGHLVLGEPDLLAAEVGERQVGDLEVLLGRRLGDGHAAVVSVSLGGVSGEARRRWCFCCSQESQSSDATPSGRSGRSSNQCSRAARRSASDA